MDRSASCLRPQSSNESLSFTFDSLLSFAQSNIVAFVRLLCFSASWTPDPSLSHCHRLANLIDSNEHNSAAESDSRPSRTCWLPVQNKLLTFVDCLAALNMCDTCIVPTRVYIISGNGRLRLRAMDFNWSRSIYSSFQGRFPAVCKIGSPYSRTPSHTTDSTSCIWKEPERIQEDDDLPFPELPHLRPPKPSLHNLCMANAGSSPK